MRPSRNTDKYKNQFNAIGLLLKIFEKNYWHRPVATLQDVAMEFLLLSTQKFPPPTRTVSAHHVEAVFKQFTLPVPLLRSIEGQLLCQSALPPAQVVEQ